jgi:hypothetical protein
MARVLTGPLFPVDVGQIIMDFAISVEENYRYYELSRRPHGKTIWDAKDYGDHDRFFVEVVKPLRELEIFGLFEGSLETEAAIDGSVRIFAVEITGPINYEFKMEDSV